MSRFSGSLRRAIVRAAPTCTLWRKAPSGCVYCFVFFPAWKVTALEYILAAGYQAYLSNF